MNTMTTEFKNRSIYRIDENLEKLNKCIEELNEDEIWRRPNESSNSVGNLVLHLCGNIRQYVISALGKAEDTRERDQEFAASGGYSKHELLEKLSATIAEAKKIIVALSEDELLASRSVQGYEESGIGIIIHVTEHLSYHTGQIAFWVKLLKNQDLGFYAGVNLNAKNKINR